LGMSSAALAVKATETILSRKQPRPLGHVLRMKTPFGEHDMRPLEKFGKLFVENVRDKPLAYLQLMFGGHWKAPALQPLQSKVSNLSPDLKALVSELAEDLLTHAMHDLLFAFQESHDGNTGIEIVVDGKPIAGLSDGLHGELFGKDGWIVRYSKFPSETELARTREAEEAIRKMLREGEP
jgi:hypothetical protein